MFKSFHIHFGWYVASFLVALLLLLPVLYIGWGLFSPANDTWQHLAEHLLSTYFVNTLLVLGGMAVCTLLLGVPTAWLVSHYTFPFRKVLSWALLLPLALPAYINAYTYKYLFTKGLVANLLGLQLDVMHLSGAVFVLSVVLYPYVYLITRNAFEQQAQSLSEASMLLGKSKLATFFLVTLPLARPAVIGGLLLVMMEGLNEFGTFKYFSIQTFSTGIFRAWFAMGSLSAAIRLAACLLVLVFVLLSIEQWQRRKLRINSSQTPKPLRKQELKSWRGLAAFLVCFFPVFVGFLLPVVQLIHWASMVWQELTLPNFGGFIANSLLLAVVSGVVVVLPTILLNYLLRISGKMWVQTAVRVASLGYAVPGAIIAIGSMAVLIGLDHWLTAILPNKGNHLWLSGTIWALVYAYTVRFFAVASQPVESGWQQISKNIDSASALLGKNHWQTLFLVHLPLLKRSVMAAMLLIMVDILKELPLTLILRPFNFDTLATAAFELADDERLPSASVASLLIILVGLLPVLLLNSVKEKET